MMTTYSQGQFFLSAEDERRVGALKDEFFQEIVAHINQKNLLGPHQEQHPSENSFGFKEVVFNLLMDAATFLFEQMKKKYLTVRSEQDRPCFCVRGCFDGYWNKTVSAMISTLITTITKTSVEIEVAQRKPCPECQASAEWRPSGAVAPSNILTLNDFLTRNTLYTHIQHIVFVARWNPYNDFLLTLDPKNAYIPSVSSYLSNHLGAIRKVILNSMAAYSLGLTATKYSGVCVEEFASSKGISDYSTSIFQNRKPSPSSLGSLLYANALQAVGTDTIIRVNLELDGEAEGRAESPHEDGAAYVDLHAHRLVLATRSEYFQRMLEMPRPTATAFIEAATGVINVGGSSLQPNGPFDKPSTAAANKIELGNYLNNIASYYGYSVTKKRPDRARSTSGLDSSFSKTKSTSDPPSLSGSLSSDRRDSVGTPRTFPHSSSMSASLRTLPLAPVAFLHDHSSIVSTYKELRRYLYLQTVSDEYLNNPVAMLALLSLAHQYLLPDLVSYCLASLVGLERDFVMDEVVCMIKAHCLYCQDHEPSYAIRHISLSKRQQVLAEMGTPTTLMSEVSVESGTMQPQQALNNINMVGVNQERELSTAPLSVNGAGSGAADEENDGEDRLSSSEAAPDPSSTSNTTNTYSEYHYDGVCKAFPILEICFLESMKGPSQVLTFTAALGTLPHLFRRVRDEALAWVADLPESLADPGLQLLNELNKLRLYNPLCECCENEGHGS